MHPATSLALSDKVFLDDRFHPVPGIWVSKVNHCESNRQTIDQVHFSVFILDKVAFVAAFCELILSDAFDLTGVLDVRVDVDEGFDAIDGPVTDHSVPFRIPVLFKLPVPDKTSALGVGVLANPILHPDADHGQTT